MNKILIIFLLCSTLKIYSQNFSDDVIPPDYIGTIQLFNPVTQSQSPFIGDNEYFQLSFDDLNSTYQRYYYYIRHYDRNWEPSDLFNTEYIRGYFQDDITNYQPSFNTLQNYVHYELTFPNERMAPKVSGNYKLFVFTKDKKNPLFSVRFSVFENEVMLGLQGSILNTSDQEANQRLQVIARSNGRFNLNDNIRRTSLTLIQNNDWFHCISNIKPQFNFNDRLEFQQVDLAFKGGNEYQWFDTKNIEIKGLTTYNIVERELYYAYLLAIESYPRIYEYNPDVNGAFYIRRNDLGIEREASTDGDYIHMNFALQIPKNDQFKYYVVGAFNRYELSETNEMHFHEEHGFYETDILLKQGYYNYRFVAVDSKGNRNYDLNGNFWQTENLYTALMYYQSFNENFDRLIGIGELAYAP